MSWDSEFGVKEQWGNLELSFWYLWLLLMSITCWRWLTKCIVKSKRHANWQILCKGNTIHFICERLKKLFEHQEFHHPILSCPKNKVSWSRKMKYISWEVLVRWQGCLEQYLFSFCSRKAGISLVKLTLAMLEGRLEVYAELIWKILLPHDQSYMMPISICCMITNLFSMRFSSMHRRVWRGLPYILGLGIGKLWLMVKWLLKGKFSP